MKIIKIDIQKTPWFLEKPKEDLRLLKLKDERAFTRLPEDGAILEEFVEYEYIRYLVEEVVRPDGRSEFFLVPVDDRNMFIDLINMSKAAVKRIVQQAVEEKNKYWIARNNYLINTTRTAANYNTKVKIRRLSWWKRLFNQF